MTRQISAGLVFLSVGICAYAANPYQEQITIHHPGTRTLTNYQVRVIINTAQLVAQGRMQSDCDDIRFADSNGTPANYWLQTGCNTAQTSLWVKVPTINPGLNTIRIGYGDFTASSGSDGNATFLFFDGFSGTSLDTAKWAIQFDPNGSGGAGPEITVGGDMLTMAGDAINSGEGVYGPMTPAFGVPVAFGARAKRDAGWADVNVALVYPAYGVVTTGIQNYGQYFGVGFPAPVYHDFTMADHNWHDYDTLVCNQSALFSISNVVDRYRLQGTDLTGAPGQLWMRTWGTATMMVDYVFVRKMDPGFEGFTDPTCHAPADPLAILSGLVASVNQLVANGLLDHGNGNALTAKLNAAIASLKKGNIRPACNQLGAFTNQVAALLKSGRLPAADAQLLLGGVTEASGLIGCAS